MATTPPPLGSPLSTDWRLDDDESYVPHGNLVVGARRVLRTTTTTTTITPPRWWWHPSLAWIPNPPYHCSRDLRDVKVSSRSSEIVPTPSVINRRGTLTYIVRSSTCKTNGCNLIPFWLHMHIHSSDSSLFFSLIGMVVMWSMMAGVCVRCLISRVRHVYRDLYFSWVVWSGIMDTSRRCRIVSWLPILVWV